MGRGTNVRLVVTCVMSNRIRTADRQYRAFGIDIDPHLADRPAVQALKSGIGLIYHHGLAKAETVLHFVSTYGCFAMLFSISPSFQAEI